MHEFLSRNARAFAVLLAASLVTPAPARAFEFFDGRLEVHGFGEVQLRVLNDDFSDDYDLSQWYNVLNIEAELDIAPDGFGPFSALSAFTRVEVRYDCVWRRACGLSSSTQTYGDRVGKGPDRFTNGETTKLVGTSLASVEERILEDRRADGLVNFEPFDRLNEFPGPDQERGTADDPWAFVFRDVLDFDFFARRVSGPALGNAVQILGPWRPRDNIRPVGKLRTTPSPFDPFETNPITGMRGSDRELAYPFRPVPLARTDETGLNKGVAQGMYYPSLGLQRFYERDRFSPFDQNFRQRELEFNRGGSQQDEKELKELYLDVELFDGRLWLRLGKQTIVWGKTELFRSQDQINPQDLGLASLPTLEESRIALWSARAVWSFYDVGPFEDVRLELALVLDDFEPDDFGACGEAYAPNPICNKAFGLFIHGYTGAGLAGEDRPPGWWNDSHGLEYGARLEFRWGQLSFAVTNYYGFEDRPTAVPIFNYRRNVDPWTGRPRFAESGENCDPEGLFGGGVSGCLGEPLRDPLPERFRGNLPTMEQLIPTTSIPPDLGRIPDARDRFRSRREEILRAHHANQATYQLICDSSIGFTDAFPGLENECAFNIFGSQVPINLAGLTLPVAEAVGQILAGSNALVVLLDGLGLELLADLDPLPALLPLNTLDRRTGEGRFDNINIPPLGSPLTVGNLASSLTPEQQALLGCGAYYGTSCDVNGIDFQNAEASALLQSFPSFDGTPLFGFTTLSGPQPGTVGFNGGPVCTRYERGRQFILPGCRGPGDPHYDPDLDGDPIFNIRVRQSLLIPADAELAAFNLLKEGFALGAGVEPCPDAMVGDRLYHPLTCAPFQSEMAALSWNLLVLAVIFSADQEEDGFGPEDFDEFDPSRPFDDSRCSWASPQFCYAVSDLMGLTGNRRNDMRAGGNGRFGRRDFVWHGSQELVLRYQKRNVLGFSMDFAEDRSKTNWSIEFTWVEGLPVADANSEDGISNPDQYRLTFSVDRPTFINFLNANRTFLFNMQVFLSYTQDWDRFRQANGPWNMLTTFTIISGYFQDRLLTNLTLVYDVQSNSGAGLPAITFRFNQDFSATFGMNFFYGRVQRKRQFLNPVSVRNNAGTQGYRRYVENGLGVVRDRDEVFLRLRYTF